MPLKKIRAVRNTTLAGGLFVVNETPQNFGFSTRSFNNCTDPDYITAQTTPIAVLPKIG
jgi:hypothetical protein